MEIVEGLHYIEHPLADIWVGVVAVNGDRLLFVDSATRAAVEETILPYLSENGLSISGKPALVVNTHCHSDHIGGNAGLKKALEAEIAAHEADASYVENRVMQYQALFGCFSGYENLAVNLEDFLAFVGEDTPVDRRLVDGDKINLGAIEFEVIHTPGHTDGSIVLYEPSQGILLVSDAIQGNGTTDTEVPLIVNSAAYCNSMRRLVELDISLLVAAHPFMPYQKAFFHGSAANQFIRESEESVREYLHRVSDLLPVSAEPISLLKLGNQLSQQVGLPYANRYLLMLASACLDELVSLKQAKRLSGVTWSPESTFLRL